MTPASPENLARSTPAAVPRLIQDSACGVLVLGTPALSPELEMICGLAGGL